MASSNSFPLIRQRIKRLSCRRTCCFTGRTVFNAWFMVQPYRSFIHQASWISCASADTLFRQISAISFIREGSYSARSDSPTT